MLALAILLKVNARMTLIALGFLVVLDCLSPAKMVRNSAEVIEVTGFSGLTMTATPPSRCGVAVETRTKSMKLANAIRPVLLSFIVELSPVKTETQIEELRR